MSELPFLAKEHIAHMFIGDWTLEMVDTLLRPGSVGLITSLRASPAKAVVEIVAEELRNASDATAIRSTPDIRHWIVTKV